MPLRADARRNRARILEAAEAVFGTEGLAASTEEIARSAGLGIGTVFRHFPTKQALAEAVVGHRIARLAEVARELDGDDAFFEFFSLLVEQAGLNLALSDALSSDAGQAVAEAKRELNAAGEALLRRAQKAGVVRTDVTSDDMRALVAGCLTMEREAGGPAGRMVEVVCAGLRARR